MPRLLPVPPLVGSLSARQSRVLALLAAAVLAAALALARAAPVRSAEPDVPAPVVGVTGVAALASWLEARESGARTRLDEAERAAAARLDEEHQAAARLAEAEERSTAALAARQALEGEFANASAAGAAAEDTVGHVAAGLAALAAPARRESAGTRDVAHLRALVGSLAGLVVTGRDRAQELREEADRLATRERDLEAQLAEVTTERETRRAGLAAATSALLDSLREADEARRRRDALVAYTGSLRASDGNRIIRDTASDISPQPAPVRDLGAGARAALPPPALTAAPAAFGTATAPSGVAEGLLLDPIAARPVEARGDDRFRFGPGVLLETGVAQTVSVPCAGRVVFAEPFKDFGLLLIIDRGDGYHALLSGMSRLRVGRGETVVAGQAVGAIELVDGVARLYLELRRHGSPVDPSAWSSLPEDRVRS